MKFKAAFISLIFLILSLSYQASAGEEGIVFSEKSWAEVQAQAKAENKYIFVDAFAVWCGPCKWMDKNVFTAAQVGDFFNENFISLRLDMEKGDGQTFASTYRVRAYPTFLFFDPEGNLVHRAVGGRAPAEFVTVGKAALDPNAQSETLRMRYEKGDRDETFLYNYVLMLNNTMQPTGEAFESYLDTQKESALFDEKNWELIQKVARDVNLDIFDFVTDNQEKYAKKYGEEAVFNYIGSAFENEVNKAVQSQDQEQLKSIQAQALKAMPEKRGKKFVAYSDFMFRSRDPKVAFPYAKTYFDNYVENYQELNSVAWYYFQNAQEEEEEMLKKALTWADKSVNIQADYANLDTKAHLLFALKKYDQAQKVAEEAITAGKVVEEDTRSTEELLEKIKAARE